MGFTPGSVDMEVFLIDLTTDQVAASCPVSAKTPRQVRIFTSTGKDRDTENPVVRILERVALSQMYKNLATTRGKFEHRPLL